jgi:hypothetical protein
MQAISKRFDFLFRSTHGLILVAVAVVSLITAIWGMLSGPMVEWGVRDLTVRLLGMDMVQAQREGRIIMLYHTIAMTIVAIEVYIITDLQPMKRAEQVIINATITTGYLTAVVFGLLFAYWGQNFIFHGLFLLGPIAGLFWRYLAGGRAVAMEARIPAGSALTLCPRQKWVGSGTNRLLCNGRCHIALGLLWRGNRLLLG